MEQRPPPAPRVWTVQSVAELIGREFGAELVDVEPAQLTGLGRRLVGLEPWGAEGGARL